MNDLTKMRTILISLAIFFCGVLMPLSATNAISPLDSFKAVVTKSTLTEDAESIPDVSIVIANLIRSVLLYVGILVLGLIIYAGFLWATARGNDAQIKNAKQILIGSIIGLLLIFTSGAIVDFVLTNLLVNAVS